MTYCLPLQAVLKEAPASFFSNEYRVHTCHAQHTTGGMYVLCSRETQADQQACCAQGLSTDPRPEIRNSGMRTFFTVVVSQGAKLSAPIWDELLWEMMFPLLQTVHHMSATSSKEEVTSYALLQKLSRGIFVAGFVQKSMNCSAALMPGETRSDPEGY